MWYYEEKFILIYINEQAMKQKEKCVPTSQVTRGVT
jgi:hypothetical protein